ncbi:MAG: UDP-N-acetylmuramoyl-L-alanine--D-glutamate ligase [Acidobacteriota bacterium]
MFAGNSVLVIGMARSGVAAAVALAKRGAVVAIYDRKTPDQLPDEVKMLSPGVEILNGNVPPITRAYDLAIVSPGISLESPAVMTVKEQGIPIMGEVELAYLIKSDAVKLIAITGTNGKTTTTALVANILKTGGIESAAAGNIGVALVSVVDSMQHGIIAVEVSSFQLETIEKFHPVCSGIINITPDHLDRHKTMENYAAIKARVFENQTDAEYTFINLEDPWLNKMSAPCKLRYFSTDRVLKQGVWVEDGSLYVNLENQVERVCGVSELRLRGKHNLENSLCAVGMARAVGVDIEVIRQSLMTFGGVRHRLEEAGRIDGVLYINDSKGTNPDSTIKALESFAEPIVLIAGGRNKGSDFSVLAELIKEKVKALVLVGEAKSIIKEAVQKAGVDNIFEVDTFEDAVIKARKQAVSGDVVLLSPACASWDMFNNYEERGDLFCDIVQSFKEGA